MALRRIVGTCPSCGSSQTLQADAAGVIACASLVCREPSAVHAILNDPSLNSHLVTLGPGQDFTMVHPLIERLHDLRDCTLHILVDQVSEDDKGWVTDESGDVLAPGEYRVTKVYLGDDPSPEVRRAAFAWEPV